MTGREQYRLARGRGYPRWQSLLKAAGLALEKLGVW